MPAATVEEITFVHQFAEGYQVTQVSESVHGELLLVVSSRAQGQGASGSPSSSLSSVHFVNSTSSGRSSAFSHLESVDAVLPGPSTSSITTVLNGGVAWQCHQDGSRQKLEWPGGGAIRCYAASQGCDYYCRKASVGVEELIKYDRLLGHETVLHILPENDFVSSVAWSPYHDALFFTTSASYAVWKLELGNGCFYSPPKIVAGSALEPGCGLGLAAAARFGAVRAPFSQGNAAGRFLQLAGVDGDGGVVIADDPNCRLLLLSGDGEVSLLADYGKFNTQGPNGQSGFPLPVSFGPPTPPVVKKLMHLAALTAGGTVVVWDSRRLLEVHAGLKPPSLSRQLGCSPCGMPDWLQNLLFNEEGADVHFEVDGQSIPGHSQVLRASSDYYRALLNPGWAEQQSSGFVRVDPEHPAHVFRAVLSWIYTKVTPAMETSDLPALLCAASFYLLPDLHAECLKVAHASLSVHNALEWLLLAVQHREEELRAAAKLFVAANYKRMKLYRPQQSSELLQRLFLEHPDVAEELMDLGMVGGSALRKCCRGGDSGDSSGL